MESPMECNCPMKSPIVNCASMKIVPFVSCMQVQEYRYFEPSSKGLDFQVRFRHARTYAGMYVPSRHGRCRHVCMVHACTYVNARTCARESLCKVYTGPPLTFSNILVDTHAQMSSYSIRSALVPFLSGSRVICEEGVYVRREVLPVFGA